MGKEEVEVELPLPPLVCGDCGGPCGGAHGVRCAHCSAVLEDKERSLAAECCRGCEDGTGPLCGSCRVEQLAQDDEAPELERIETCRDCGDTAAYRCDGCHAFSCGRCVCCARESMRRMEGMPF